MKCPRDKNNLSQYAVTNYAIDVCKECHGVWFDYNEFRKTYNLLSLEKKHYLMDILKMGRLKSAPLAHVIEKSKVLPCPQDGTPMKTYAYASDSGVYINTCEICGGIWLDGGEFEKILHYIDGDSVYKALGKLFASEWRIKREKKAENEELMRLLTSMTLVTKPIYAVAVFIQYLLQNTLLSDKEPD